MRRWCPLIVLFCISIAGCVHRPPSMVPALAGSCRSDAVRWFAPEDRHHRARLDAWCAGVGTPVIQPLPSGTDRTHLDVLREIVFVSWNVHVGNGDIRAFVRDLRAGHFTSGRAVRHFVLLLQEAVRNGGVPPYDPDASGANRISADATDADIV